MDGARIEVLLDGRVDHLVLLDQALADELLGLDAYGEMIPTRAHEVVDAGTTSRQVRLDQFLDDVQFHERRVA